MGEQVRSVASARGRRWRSRVAVAVSVVVLGACSPASDTDAAGGSAWAPGPLEELMAAVRGPTLHPGATQQEAEAHVAALLRHQEGIIAACMAEQGFDYVPNVPDFGVVLGGAGTVTPSGVAYGSRDFAQRYGFGISTADLLAATTAAPATPRPDPNAERVAAMSAAEREAWDLALWGDRAARGEEHNPLESGCWGYAQHLTWETSAGAGDEFAALAAEVEGHQDRVASDPRAIELDAEWASCMSDAGHPGLLRPRGEGSVSRALWDEWDLLNGGGVAADVVRDWDWEAHPDGPEGLFPGAAAVAEFTEREIALAVADFDCRARTGFEARRTAIDHDLQQQFVDRHGAELEAWALSVAERRTN